MNKYERFFGTFTKWGDYLARLGMVALLVLVVANVIMRYAFKSIQGAYDYVGLITAIAVSLAVAYTAYERGHIEIEILMDHFSDRVQSVVGTIMFLISTAFFCIVAWQSVVVGMSMKEANETTMAVYVQLYPFLYILAFGMGLTALAFLIHTIKYASKALKP
ncbi:MAG: TRAP transporter small permease [Actinobacteria bacterium]|mgnify:CR=1 FL=1|nr:TRAP transporter small permease [Actinomycetota bacterium]